jgi:DNA-binding MarR family transcriptional regulator
MSESSKAQLMDDLVIEIKRFQDAVDRFDTAAAAGLGVNATDLRCLTALYDRGPLLAGEVASTLGLTRGATTTALNRLQTARYVKRSANVDDGRSFRIELTKRGRTAIEAIWRPIRMHGRTHLEQYREADLTLLTLFFRRSVDLHERCLAAVAEA